MANAISDAARAVFGGMGDVVRALRGLPGRVAGAIGDLRGAGRGLGRSANAIPSAGDEIAGVAISHADEAVRAGKGLRVAGRYGDDVVEEGIKLADGVPAGGPALYMPQMVKPPDVSGGPTGRYIPKAEKAAVVGETSGYCRYCGIKLSDQAGPSRLNYDHIEPWSKGGPSLRGDLTPACRTCNLRKTDMDFDSWMRVLRGG